ncbi:mandelate racemase/muconate lactonizing enzyme family protein [uncultured Alsobacter sp.]|uniref:mandelate racemase/muconate lactonizing enzyme family protein n=1 Tax=uncultured Alsobacter sp. TaxID=1748258 RepID=UPI0025D028EE|nr:mandelate racemase/muconate lactonizing enzyme family protein [uncultured Alsobacter sp.]
MKPASGTHPVITAVEPLLLRLPLERPISGPFGRLEARPNLLVRVTLEGGQTGLGEVWANFPPWGCQERIDIVRHVLAPFLVGQVLDDPVRLYGAMHRRLRLLANQWGAPGPVHQAVAGVDIALWDAHARLAGLPLARMLRGDGIMPARVPVYASGIAPPHVSTTIADAMHRGHCRFKIRFSFGEDTDRETIRTARALAGDRPVMADANQTMTRESFLAMAPLLKECRLEFLEEPFPVDDTQAYRAWPRDLGIPLAFGENAQGLASLEDVIGMADFVQPDITKTGGISEGLVIGRKAVAAGKKLCFHMFGGAVGLYASAHLTAAIDGAHWLEMDANPNPLFDSTLDVKPAVADGALVMPQGPGLGIALAPEAIERWG